MYVPKLTSGPSGVTWSPDGTSLVYSMAGSLWRQKLGSDVAEQLTDGPGYHFQPDWAPDGKSVVFSSYRDDAIELAVLDLETLEIRDLTANRAVNLDPRWSPNGRKLAFVSTLHEGRFHIFTAGIDAGRAGRAERITRDLPSNLPRYYYDRHDHYLSPAWSPDGRELILVSNRGRISGSGGLWRMRAETGAEPRLLHDEETTWRAAPAWDRGGRIVFGSHAGRQWHQLFLMPSDGGQPFQLTYGDFDATLPRWSPAGDRIAYISNESGNTALWTVDLPGGRRGPVVIRERRYLRRSGQLTIEVVDARARRIPARVTVTLADGRGIAPNEAWLHADDAYDRGGSPFEGTYFHTDGGASLRVPAGRVTVEASHGILHRARRETIDVPAGTSRTLRLRLANVVTPLLARWYSGDLHVHMNYGGLYRNDPARLAFQARAEDVDLAANLVVNKEGRVPDVGYFAPGRDPASTARTLIFHAQEFHTNFWGHTALLGLGEQLLLPGYAGYPGTAAQSLYPTNAAVFDLARAQGAIGGYVHPFDTEPDPLDTATPLTSELPVDAALGRVDYLELVGFHDPLATARVWYRLLKCGFRIAAGAGTDAMANFAQPRGPVGLSRVYVRAPRLELRTWLAALRAGRSFATNGPLLDFSLGGKRIGDTLDLPNGRHEIGFRARLRSIVPIDRLEIVSNGDVVATLPVEGDRTRADVTGRLPMERSGWYTLRAWNQGARWPIRDAYAFATTSPIYTIVGSRPIESATDASYFLAWIDRTEAAMIEYVESGNRWARPEERAAVLATFSEARAAYRKQLGHAVVNAL